jgi:lysyl-tRNA synthetase class 2
MNFEKWLATRQTPEFRQRMAQRAHVLGEVRRFFAARDFLEVETPIMVRLPGMEPNLEPNKTAVRSQGGTPHDAYLITSPEYSMKKLLSAGYERIFEITRSFRDCEPWDGSHNPEFTMLEWYRAGSDYLDLMTDTEEMVVTVAENVLGTSVIKYQGRRIDLGRAWERVSVAEAMARHANLDLAKAIGDVEWFRHEVQRRGLSASDTEGFDDLFFRLFLRDVEPKLGQNEPLMLYDYPLSMAALARIKAGDDRYAERVEVYCGGLELANGFSELTNAQEQRHRLQQERADRQANGCLDYGLDEDFLQAVGRMPPSAGIAFGLDRLVMLLTDAPSIREVLFFPAEAVWNE